MKLWKNFGILKRISKELLGRMSSRIPERLFSAIAGEIDKFSKTTSLGISAAILRRVSKENFVEFFVGIAE